MRKFSRNGELPGKVASGVVMVGQIERSQSGGFPWIRMAP